MADLARAANNMAEYMRERIPVTNNGVTLEEWAKMHHNGDIGSAYRWLETCVVNNVMVKRWHEDIYKAVYYVNI